LHWIWANIKDLNELVQLAEAFLAKSFSNKAFIYFKVLPTNKLMKVDTKKGEGERWTMDL